VEKRLFGEGVGGGKHKLAKVGTRTDDNAEFNFFSKGKLRGETMPD